MADERTYLVLVSKDDAAEREAAEYTVYGQSDAREALKAEIEQLDLADQRPAIEANALREFAEANEKAHIDLPDGRWLTVKRDDECIYCGSHDTHNSGWTHEGGEQRYCNSCERRYLLLGHIEADDDEGGE